MTDLNPKRCWFRMRQDDFDVHLAESRINKEACLDLSMLDGEDDRMATIEENVENMKAI